ncbi:phage tail tape measure protein [uncultured Chryseobacterium sp.]|uniref:phage tail tape measure protein n=1 Tax=uncultured Chryseobacterium sp. TaxID=259322 RepID=UPI0025DD0409|nr:phage tail tape measure protein [uncultured Chryseobacterium sp.]
MKRVITNAVLVINGQQVEDTFNGLKRAVNQYERQLKNLTPGTQEYIRVSQNLKEVKKRFNEVKEEIKNVDKELEKTKEDSKGFMDVFKGSFAADMLEKGLGLLKEWGVALKERVDELAAIKSTLSTLDGNLKGDKLDKAAASVKAIAETYGKSVEEVQSGVKALNAQTKDTTKSLELIKQGFDAGADASGEMLTQIKEYPTMMKDAKVSASEMIAIMAQAEKMGVYDDKGIDAIKEGMLKVREGTKSTKDAMTALGIDVPKTYQKIASGAMSYFDVLQLVSKKINDIGPDSRVTGTAIADIFGGPGEDAGYEYLSQLQNINTDLNKLTKNLDSTTVSKKKELEANEKLNGVWVKLTGTASTLNNMYSDLKISAANMLATIFNIKEAKVSDEYMNQELRLRYLKTQLDNTNVSEERKLELFQALKTEFPQYFSGLDLEKMKHDEITKAINRSIDALGRKYKAQVFQEKFDKTSLDFNEKFATAADAEVKAQRVLGDVMKQFPQLSKFQFKSSTTFNQLKELRVELDKLQKPGSGAIWDKNSWYQDTTLKRDVDAAINRLSNANRESLNADKKRREEQALLLKAQSNLIPDTFSTPNAPNNPGSKDKDLDAANAAAKEAEAKRKKAVADAKAASKKLAAQNKKDMEDAFKTEVDSANKLLDIQISYKEKQKV